MLPTRDPRRARKLWLAALFCCCHVPMVLADDYSLHQEEPSTGTSIRKRVFFGSALPISKPYQALSTAEKAIVRGYYDNMPDADEPPYPRHGLISIYRAITAAQGKLLESGDVEMYALVDGNGQIQKVSVYKSPGPEVSRVFSAVLLLTEFKPAVCHGQPCAMEFPLVLTLKTVR